jgi:hypothetical protein
LNKEISELAVFDRPKSALSESLERYVPHYSFSIKSKRQRRKNVNDYILSEWRRKNFCSLNIATVLP